VTSEVEFIVYLLGILFVTLIVGGVAAYKLRKRAYERRIKNHFKSKTQPGRPTQS
jgi:hypothetical protein